MADVEEVVELVPERATSLFAAAVPISSQDVRYGALLVCAPSAHEEGIVRFASTVADLAAASLATVGRLSAGSEEARRDALTGLWNHRAFHEHLGEALSRASLEKQEVALVLFDLDDFKDVNDREGHLVGDRMLRDVARVTLGVIRTGEEAFRIGGEEFAVVLGGGVEPARRVAERLRRALAGKRRGHGAPTISAGVAAFPADAGDREALIHKADLGLYAAKERGKDRVVCYHERLQAETRTVHQETHRLREEEWWRKVLGMASVRRALADEPGPGCRPKEVAVLAEQIGLRLGLSELELRGVVIGALLVELSKLRIPDRVRRKPGPLGEADWQLVRESAELTAAAIAPIGSLDDVLAVVRDARERWDSTGYPAGLAGEEISLGARIVAVCDAYCAMTSQRSYRPARSQARAVLELREHAGTHFDPTCVDTLLEVLGEGSRARAAVAVATA